MDTVLIIGKNHEEINASREVKHIRRALARRSATIRVHAVDDPQPRDIIAELRTQNPVVLHMISHGVVDPYTGLPFFDVADEDGQAMRISLRDLRDHLLHRTADQSARRLACLVLNACHVGSWAHNFRDVADVVIGADATLPEPTAQRFAELFYEKLADGLSVQIAFDDTVDTLRLQGESGYEHLVLVQAHSGVAAQTFIGRDDERVEPRAHEHRFDVYVLFAKHDAGPVYRLASRLEARGIKSFVDSIDDQISMPGVNWMLRAEQAIDESGCGMMVLSKASMTDVMMREQYSALLLHCWNHGKRMIPVLLDNADVPSFLGPRVASDFRGKHTHEAYMAELERLERGILGKPVPKPPLADDELFP